MNNNKPFSIETILGLMTIVLGFHYFISFRFLFGYLKLHNLEFLPLISFNDITFSCIEINFKLFKLALIGLIWIFIWFFIGNDKWIIKKKSFFFSKIEFFSNKEKFQKRNSQVIIFTIVIGLILVFIYCLFLIFKLSKFSEVYLILILLLIPFAIILNIKNWTTRIFFTLIILGLTEALMFLLIITFSFMSFPDIFLLLIIIIVPFAFILFIKKRNLIFIAHLILIFIWINLFIDNFFNSIKKQKSTFSSKLEISFNVNEKQILTSDTLQCIFYGYENIVLYNTKKHEYLKFRTNEISDIKYLKK